MPRRNRNGVWKKKKKTPNKQNAANARPNVWSFCLAIYFIGYCILNQKTQQATHSGRCYVRLAICLFLMEIIFAFNNINSPSSPPPLLRIILYPESEWDAQSVSQLVGYSVSLAEKSKFRKQTEGKWEYTWEKHCSRYEVYKKWILKEFNVSYLRLQSSF